MKKGFHSSLGWSSPFYSCCPAFISFCVYSRNASRLMNTVFGDNPAYEFKYFHGSKHSRCYLSFKLNGTSAGAGGGGGIDMSAMPIAGSLLSSGKLRR